MWGILTSYDVREAATAAMRTVGSVAEPALQAAASGGPSPELRMRAREVRQVILNEPVRYLTGHTGAVGPMAFAPDGTVFATGAEDGTVRLGTHGLGRNSPGWRLPTGLEGAGLERKGGPCGTPCSG